MFRKLLIWITCEPTVTCLRPNGSFLSNFSSMLLGRSELLPYTYALDLPGLE